MTKVLWSARTFFSPSALMTVNGLIDTAAERGFTHVALADEMSVSAIPDATRRGKDKGVEVIPGAAINVKMDDDKTSFQVKCYPKSEQAFIALLQTLSAAQKQGASYSFLTETQFFDLIGTGGYLVTSGDAAGALGAGVPASVAATVAARLRAACSPGDFVYELVAVPTPHFARANALTLGALPLNANLIASPFTLYPNPEDADARDVIDAIRRHVKSASTLSVRSPHFRNLSIPTPADLDDRLKQSLALARSLDPSLAASFEPQFSDADLVDRLPYRWAKMSLALPTTGDAFDQLCRLVMTRWRARLEQPVMGYQPDKSLLPEYKDRLKLELDTLKNLGFCDYFLVVADLVNWAKEQGILVGPGRGSVGGSLVAYLIGITDVDPIRFNLLFERFINPERLDLPDADLDFQSDRRHEVIEYLKDKYGSENVGQIANYNTMQGASCIRDAGKFFGLSDKDIDCSKLVPKEHGVPVRLAQAAEQVPEIDAFSRKYPELWEIANRLEGQIRSIGTHAAGVIIASTPLRNRSVVSESGSVNWDKRTVEDMGLVKMDILGLSTLDILGRALRKIDYSYGKKIDLLALPLDDERTMAMFGHGLTVGVFQFESGGMRKLLKNLAENEPLVFDDLAAATALYRPGPLDSGLLDDYVAQKQGLAAEFYEHPAMEPALKATRGVLVYQEQVMQLARDLAGFTMAEADGVRKAMGKKDKEKMAKLRDKWVQGCENTVGMGAAQSGALWDKIEKFAGYGFNRSHAVEYSVISYWSCYLKTHYPAQFYAACMEVFDEDKLPALVKDAALRKISLLPPDINLSTAEFRPEGSNVLRIPFSRVKGLSDAASNAILEARSKVGGRFTSVAQLRENVEARKVNSRVIAVLDKIGAFASLTGDVPANHPDRLRDQLELIPGLMAQDVHIARQMERDDTAKMAIQKIIMDCRRLEGGMQTLPRFGKRQAMMVITDCPTRDEEMVGKLLEGDNAMYLKEALAEAGLKPQDIYLTTLSKVPKQGAQIANEDITRFWPYVEREIAALKPPVIVALGAAIARKFFPDMKGSIMDHAGKVIYVRELDANVVIGFNPLMMYHDPGKQSVLNEVIARAAELLSA